MKNYIHDVIERYVKHNYSQNIDRDFRTWLVDEEHSEEKDHELNALWNTTEEGTTSNFYHSLQNIRELTRTEIKHQIHYLRSRLMIWRVAAAVLITVSSISLYLAFYNSRSSDLLQVYIPTAEMRDITLPDGTQVLMNSQSTLLYPSQFTGDTRCVYLVGEANFKVKQDKKHPFIVKASDFQVTALGTEFNITAYPNEEEITTTLISGKVLVEYNGQSDKTILEPNEQLVYNKQTCSSNVLHPHIQDVTAWQHGEIVFRSMTLDEIFTQLERKYPYSFIYSFHSLKGDQFSLSFGQDDSIEEIMNIIASIAGYLDYKIEGNKCYLTVSHK